MMEVVALTTAILALLTGPLIEKVRGSVKTTVKSVTTVKTMGYSTLSGNTLEVYSPVSNVTLTVNATDLVEFNDTVRLECSAFGSSLFYRWHNGSSDITASERIHLNDDNRTLTITRVLRSDLGPLYCTVYNVFSNYTSQQVFLNISFGPDNIKVTADPPKGFHTLGSNITLSCSAQSSPPAELKWAFNGKLLNTEGPKLNLWNIQESQSGGYTCWAHNSITLRSQPSDLFVIESISELQIWIIFAATSGTLGLLALAGVAFIYMKKRKRRDSLCSQVLPTAVYENTKEFGPSVVYENLAESSTDLSRPVASENKHDYQELQFKDSATYSTLHRL